MNFGFVDPANNDYSLTASALAAINTGVDPGITSTGYSLAPTSSYQSFASSLLPRVVNEGIIDIGAFEYSGTTEVRENAFLNTIYIYPNPANSNFTVHINSFPISEKTEISVFDFQGKNVYPKIVQKATDFEIDLTGYRAGVYFLRITDNLQTITGAAFHY